ncbi:MAG: hypothetical protein OEY56_00445 [Cyclobacteriaceae bacterium]|nr:hypothetical protein [Cyclobacteriaceae bacterium]
MKKIALYIAIVGFFTACNELDLAEQGIVLKELPGYVAFDAPGTSVSLDTVSRNEDGTNIVFTIECPTGTLTDITVSYTFSGTAVFGTDFNVAGATSAGGTIVLTHIQSTVPGEYQDFDNVDLIVEPLTDGVIDGTKTLSITLASATNGDGESVAVGRGGMDILKVANAKFNDID